jgi:serine/threonine protein kinase/tetratricopeptide (TPR) repeat protein
MNADPNPAKAIFLEAVERHVPEQWPAFLDRACAGQPELRGRVEVLLEAHREAGTAPHRGGVEGAAPVAHDAGAAECPGHVVGPYKLLQPIGEGGMGAVWMAEQLQPVQRKVALKIIKAGMDSRQVLARFEAERQALALMDHPNIAKVHDGGSTDTGRPYFVMELVKGQPITKYCDAHRLTPRQRLELFIPVCQAIQHAHQKGIIHRDVKPSNVLVAPYDGQPVVKVIDFGIAKATGQRLTEKTLFTEFGAVVGTLEYMSPEQAELNQLDIDTRSDIYSLGVLLYELLTGTTPLNRARLKQAAFIEVLRWIREEEPPRPSTRLSESKDTLASISAQRQTEPVKLTKLVRGELDWIAMKALEKDRSRRYETASAFAADVQRYLADEPVHAGPPSARYRLKKFLRRHRKPVLAGAVVFVALVLGMIGTTWQAIRATDAERRTALQLGETEKEGARAEKNFHKAIEAVDQMMLDVGQTDLAWVPGMESVRRRVLERALKFFEWFLQEKGNDPRVRFEAGMAQRRVGTVRELLGEHAKAEQAFDRALALLQAVLAQKDRPVVRRELARTYLNRSTLHQQLGRRDRAEADTLRGLHLLEALYAQDAANPDNRGFLASALAHWGHLLSHRGKLAEAEKACRRAVALQETLAAEFPDNVPFQNVLAGTLGSLAELIEPTGRPEEAEKLYRRVIAIAKRTRRRFPENHDLRGNEFSAYLNLGTKLIERGRTREAQALLGEAAKRGEGLVKEFPGIPGYREALAGTYNNWGLALRNEKHLDQAASHYQRAREIQQTLVHDFPRLPRHHGGLGSTLNNLAVVRRDQGNLDEARKLLEEAVKYQLTALRIDGKQRTYRVFLSNHYSNLANVLKQLKAPAEDVDRAHERAAAVGRKLADDYREVADYQHAAGDALISRSDVLIARGKREEARLELHDAVKYQRAARTIDPQHPQYWRGLRNADLALFELLTLMDRDAEFEAASWQAISFLEKLVAHDAPTPKDREVRAGDLSMLAATLHNLATRHLKRDEKGEARRLLERAIPHQQAALEISPNDPKMLQFLSNHYHMLGELLSRTGQAEAAKELRRKHVGVLEKLVAHRLTDPAFRSGLAAKQNDTALALLKTGRELDEARRLLEQAVGHQQAALKAQPNNEQWRRFLGTHFSNLGEALVKLRKPAEAEKAYRDCVKVRKQLADDFPTNVQYEHDLADSCVTLGDQLNGDERAEEKEKLYRLAVAICRGHVTRFPKNPVSHSLLGNTLHKLAVLGTGAGKLAEARDLLTEAVTHQKIARDARKGGRYHHDLAVSLHTLAELLARLKTPEQQVVAGYRVAIDVEKQLTAACPAVPEYRHDLALSHQNLATFLVKQGKLQQAETEIIAALVLRRQLVKEHGKVADYLHNLASGHVFLGNLRVANKAWAQAEAEFRAALPYEKRALDENPGHSDYPVGMGVILCDLGSAVGSGGRVKESLDWYGQAITILTPLLEKEPRHAKARESLFGSHAGRAMSFEELKRYPEAVPDRARALELAPPAEKTICHVRLMVCRARAGQFDAALKDADQLAKDDSKDAKYIAYDCACVYGLAHARSKDDKHAVRAVELLRQTVARGYRDVAHMKQDTDLDSLRSRADFRQLMADLEKDESPKPPE